MRYPLVGLGIIVLLLAMIAARQASAAVYVPMLLLAILVNGVALWSEIRKRA